MTTDSRRKNIMQLVFLGFIVLMAAVVVAMVIARQKPASSKIITTGDRAPEFRLQALDGRYLSLDDFKGKVVMVHFWATWCPPCVEEIPSLAALNPKLPERDFQMLAVSVDEGGPMAIAQFLRGNKLSVPVLMDPNRAIANTYGTFKFPETYIVDRNGIVRHKTIGPRDWSQPDAIAVIMDIISRS